MAEFHRASERRVNAFAVGERYLFKHYFEGDDVFARLRPFYEHSQYRFAVPAPEFPAVASFLADEGYALVEAPVPEFVVLVEQYTAHPDDIFADSVAQRTVDGYNAFLLRDKGAVADATDEGAVRLTETAVENPF
ncbi:MAG: hypothetical protein ABEJ68_06415 [Halobacteriaceae archaeon]